LCKHAFGTNGAGRQNALRARNVLAQAGSEHREWLCTHVRGWYAMRPETKVEAKEKTLETARGAQLRQESSPAPFGTKPELKLLFVRP
jgi:hypothetical protein